MSDINKELIETNQIHLDLELKEKTSEEDKTQFNLVLPPKLIKNKKRHKEVFGEVKQKFEEEFSKIFRFTTQTVEYKLGLTYHKVKLIIEANRLLCYNLTSHNDEIRQLYNPVLVLDFDQISAGVSVKEKSKKFFIMVLGTPKIFKFRTNNKEILDNLLIYLNYFVETSQGSLTNLFGVSMRKDFDKNYFLFESEFVKKAKTGDLLIFRGLECPAKCQRFFTGSQYDHVALLFKRNDLLYVYESTSKDGCMMRRWRDFTAFLWNLLYDKMVYRELIINMEENQKMKYEEELIEKCDLFIKETEKKKYILSCCALVCSKKIDHEKKNDWSKSDGFFCSQLVAAAYLKCNIIKYNRGSGNFLPGNFSQEGTLELHDNFALGPEIVLDFSQ